MRLKVNTVVREGLIKEARLNCAEKVGAVCAGAHLCNLGMETWSKRIRRPGHFWLYSEFQTSLRYLRSYLKKKRVVGSRRQETLDLKLTPIKSKT